MAIKEQYTNHKTNIVNPRAKPGLLIIHDVFTHEIDMLVDFIPKQEDFENVGTLYVIKCWQAFTPKSVREEHEISEFSKIVLKMNCTDTSNGLVMKFPEQTYDFWLESALNYFQHHRKK